MTPFCLEEIQDILQAIHTANFRGVLVGGQGVNAWVHRYHQESPAWVQLRPYSSVDLDYHGGIVEAKVAAMMIERSKIQSGLPPSCPAPWPASTWEFLRRSAAIVRGE